jgi:glutamate synthase (NADPH/NADH) small chain
MFSAKKSFFSPFKFLSNIFKKSMALRYPVEENPVFDKFMFRGKLINDRDKCARCRTCAQICLSGAIGFDRDGFPVIDYGKCSLCGLCVDICTTGSLSMSSVRAQSVKSPVDKNGKNSKTAVFKNFYVPTLNELTREYGYFSEKADTLLSLNGVKTRKTDIKNRIQGFDTVKLGFETEEAVYEASRCVGCGKCVEACPAQIDIPVFIRAIWENKPDYALRTLIAENPFSAVCGYICPRYCEKVCPLCKLGNRISIRMLERWVWDNATPDIKPKSPRLKGKTVSIIGAGVTGLCAGYYLSQKGYDVIIYETMDKIGGKLRYATPQFRLPNTVLDFNLDIIRSSGVEIKNSVNMNKRLFSKICLSDAVLIATGNSGSETMRIKGSETPGFFNAVPLMERIATGSDIPIGDKILVIGSDDFAFDTARSLLRIQKIRKNRNEVSIITAECRKSVPAQRDLVDEAIEEGVIIKSERLPAELIFDKSGKMFGVKSFRCVNPVSGEINADDVEIFSADMIVETVNRNEKPDFLSFSDLKSDRYGLIREPDNDNIFVAESDDIINGIALGKKSARLIDKFLKPA